MSEFAPPSYTGDPNMARCAEDYFKLGFWGLQIGLAFTAAGGILNPINDEEETFII